MKSDIMKFLADKKLAFTDLELTGLCLKKHEIIEIGVLIYNQHRDEIEKEWSVKVAPLHIETASQKALVINGYINNPDNYRNKLNPSLIKFNSIVKGCMLVGYNIGCDVGFIKRDMDKLNIRPTFSRIPLDLMSMVWFAIKDSNIKGMSLDTVCDYFDICNIGSHSALIDCRRSYELYRKLNSIYKI
jgi:DNA polymerase III alpha subunit (gram-positive type)